MSLVIREIKAQDFKVNNQVDFNQLLGLKTEHSFCDRQINI